MCIYIMSIYIFILKDLRTKMLNVNITTEHKVFLHQMHIIALDSKLVWPDYPAVGWKTLVASSENPPQPPYFQYSSLGLVLLVWLTTSDTPTATALVTLARLPLRVGPPPTTPLQSGVFQGLLQ